jgi:poly-gamma-glutamate synthesis protein (capsule biosynthesis protein)
MHVKTFDKFAKGTFKILFLGDIMCENAGINSIADGDPFKYVGRWMSTHDYVVGGLETTLSGVTSDYPKFSSNDLLADYLHGKVDLLFTANNHSFDYGVEGVERTVEVLDEFGIGHIGTSSAKKRRTIFDKTLANHELSFLNYTQFLNAKEEGQEPIYKGLDSKEAPEGIINFYQQAQVREDIALAKKRSEIVIIGLHQSLRTGAARELTRESSEKQRQRLERLANDGADVVIGSHPHYFQGGKLLEHGKIAIYSLGNFYSTMKSEKYPLNCGCAMTMECDGFSNINYSFLPLVTIREEKSGQLVVLPMAPLEFGAYPFIGDEQRVIVLQELAKIRETLRICSLTETEVPIQLI